jgi:hypothetical protein
MAMAINHHPRKLAHWLVAIPGATSVPSRELIVKFELASNWSALNGLAFCSLLSSGMALITARSPDWICCKLTGRHPRASCEPGQKLPWGHRRWGWREWRRNSCQATAAAGASNWAAQKPERHGGKWYWRGPVRNVPSFRRTSPANPALAHSAQSWG